jgi:dolichol-phosphate mannosyltransferase
MSRVLVVIPTYNERGNILSLLPDILQGVPDVHILVVDDNSPDGTAQVVRDWQRSHSQIHLLERTIKEGLGRAYVAGFQWGLEQGYDVIGQMDADYSHRIIDLQRLINAFTENLQFVVGSRWMREGKIKNWDWNRRLLSWGGNFYARCILGGNISDWTGGFNLWRADVLRKIDLPSLEAQGYAFQIEMKYRALRLNFLGIEVPIIFEERRLGHSKMSPQIIFEALTQVWRLKRKF